MWQVFYDHHVDILDIHHDDSGAAERLCCIDVVDSADCSQETVSSSSMVAAVTLPVDVCMYVRLSQIGQVFICLSVSMWAFSPIIAVVKGWLAFALEQEGSETP